MTSLLPPSEDSNFADRYQPALDFLYGRMNFERAPDTAQSLKDFKLLRMEALLAELGNPQLRVPTVHVAGSKGKGSTATMIARIIEATGARVGLFTSPHVTHFEERFTINGQRPSRETVVALFEQVRPIAEAFDQRGETDRLTFFELVTAMAWLYFAREQVDLAVIEVGLGGRLDSTNVCAPLVSVITSISRDHMRLLGNTVELIAREKAGIAKPGVLMISGVTESGPASVIEEVACERGTPLLQLGRDFQIEASAPATPPPHRLPPQYCFDFVAPPTRFNRLQPGMPGEHQTRNAALAVSTVLKLKEHGFEIPETAIRSGLLNARCPVRVEAVSTNPLIIVDSAHNPASIDALCNTLRGVSARRKVAIFASSKDKEVGELLRGLNATFDEIWLTRYLNNARAVSLQEMESLAAGNLTKPWRSFESPTAALAEARRLADPDDLICVTGSFFLAAEVEDLFQKKG